MELGSGACKTYSQILIPRTLKLEKPSAFTKSASDRREWDHSLKMYHNLKIAIGESHAHPNNPIPNRQDVESCRLWTVWTPARCRAKMDACMEVGR